MKSFDVWDRREVRVSVDQDHFENLVNEDKILTNDKWATVEFDYPLSDTFSFKMRGPVTMKFLIKFVRKIYQEKIYKDWEKYGLWGHCIEDLVIENVNVKRNGTITLGIGS